MPNLKIRAFDFLLKDKKNLVGAEIGVFKGGHALEMLKLLDIKTLSLVDAYGTYTSIVRGGEKTWDNSPEEKIAKETLRDYKDKIEWVKFWSNKAGIFFQDESLDFVYIDGNHDYEFVLEDIELWTPKVKQGGIIGGHDYGGNFPGVEKAVKKYCGKNEIEYKVNFYLNERVNSDWAFRKGGTIEGWKFPKPKILPIQTSEGFNPL